MHPLEPTACAQLLKLPGALSVAGTAMHHAAMSGKKDTMFALAQLGCHWWAQADGIKGATAAYVLLGQHGRNSRQTVRALICFPPALSSAAEEVAKLGQHWAAGFAGSAARGGRIQLGNLADCCYTHGQQGRRCLVVTAPEIARAAHCCSRWLVNPADIPCSQWKSSI